MIFKILFTSNSKEILLTFLKMFNLFLQKNQIINSNITHELVKSNKKNYFTILKSPHVNKKAKQKFKRILYCFEIKIHVLEKKKAFLVLKFFQKNSFINFKIKTELSNIKLIKLSFINSNFLLFNNLIFSKKKALKHLILLDVYGEESFNCNLNL